ncbi:unnamed protein product [Symbiodinium sp. CCMP2592]|nr:unnamed protein product [Symbiodinium sp. CCMP2592]
MAVSYWYTGIHYAVSLLLPSKLHREGEENEFEILTLQKICAEWCLAVLLQYIHFLPLCKRMSVLAGGWRGDLPMVMSGGGRRLQMLHVRKIGAVPAAHLRIAEATVPRA